MIILGALLLLTGTVTSQTTQHSAAIIPPNQATTTEPVTTTAAPPDTTASDIRGDIVACLTEVANGANLSTPGSAQSQNYTHAAFKTICRAKDAFIQCVDAKLKNSSDSASSVFRPLFDVDTLSHAYSGLCDNLTAVEKRDLDCLDNTSALLPCYAQFNNYLTYLTVVVHFGSSQRQLSPAATQTLMCTLTERRSSCEVAVLKMCSQRISDVMAAFYDRSLPAVCKTKQ